MGSLASRRRGGAAGSSSGRFTWNTGAKLSLLCLLAACLLSATPLVAATESPSACVPDASDPGSLYNHTRVFGEGLSETVQLNSSMCFMISPMDKEARRMDRNCSIPSTNYVVLLSSDDNRVHMRATIMHLPHEGFHMACYTIMEPGTYTVSVYLTSLNYAGSLKAKNLSLENFPYTLVHEATVTATVKSPKRYKRAVEAYEASLPPCTPEVLSQWRGGEGRWVDNQWRPYSCHLRRTSPGEARKCLAGKKLLFVGDTQQLAQYATTLAYLSSTDECTLAQELGSTGLIPSIRCDKTRLTGATPFRPDIRGDKRVGVHHTEFDNGVAVTFYGTAVNGFAVGRVPEAGNFSAGGRRSVRHRSVRRALRDNGLVTRSRSRRSRRARSKGAAGAGAGETSRDHWSLDTTPNVVEAAVLSRERLNALKAELETQQKGAATLVFVAHTRASDLLFRDWMVDPRRKGPLVFDYGPFDHVLATSGVHDVFVFDSVDEYEKQLDAEYFPSLRLAVKGDVWKSVTWMGAWSVRQSDIPSEKLAPANAARAAAFDRATARAANQWTIPFIDAEPLTQARPDLAIGPAHYSWPVARAVLELWLTSICPEAAEARATC